MSKLINGKTPGEIKQELQWLAYGCPESNPECDECIHAEICSNLTERDAPCNALALIERLEAKVPKWISVEERLPEDECLALGWQNEMLIGLVYRSGAGYACESDGEYLMDVTHWMPLPEPPKEETT